MGEKLGMGDCRVGPSITESLTGLTSPEEFIKLISYHVKQSMVTAKPMVEEMYSLSHKCKGTDQNPKTNS